MQGRRMVELPGLVEDMVFEPDLRSCIDQELEHETGTT